MQRRTFLGSTGAAAAAALITPPLALSKTAAPRWDALRRKVGDRLIDTPSPLVALARNGGRDADAVLARMKNPYYLSATPGLTQTLGWTDAWTTQPSLKGVAATSAADVAAAIDFCRASGIAPVIKGGGHSYFGNSNRANSLLIWSHAMRSIDLHDGFVPKGAPAATTALPAVSVGAGCLWGEVYRQVAVEGGRYVQGGGCLTVGVGGFVQGGGFGSFSKQFGTGAANLLEAEIVTADGLVRTVNRWREPDLFYALRGGGGGTFGVVTRLTMRTHPLPSMIGATLFEITASNDSAWRGLVAEIMRFYSSTLFNPTWGEQIRFSPGRRLSVSMLCHGLTKAAIAAVWAPFLDWVNGRPGDFAFASEPLLIALPARGFWDPKVLLAMPGIVLRDDRPGAPADNVYWASNRGEAGQTLHAYQSAWLSRDLLTPARQPELVEALIRAANQWTIALHTNKGLGGGSAEAIAATRDTATNPEVLDAFALLICAAEEQAPAYPGIPGHAPNLAEGRRDAAGVTRAMAEIYRIAPNAGAYMSECDYFLNDWKQAHWGPNYPRLARAKRRYDPHSLFNGHHCVEPA
ncbi:MAG: FAD-binding protein [Sphingomicrobium sp.]